MNANKRVAINAMATYGRTLLGMVLGLFSSRWVLQSLGDVDYGLMGVVGSLIVFITFLNSVVTGACSRFFAYSIGKKDDDDLVRWFNVAVCVHTSLAVLLVIIGAPIGEWAIDNFLNIPADRLTTAHWVFRFSLFAAFWTMFNTPYIAMFTATQNIAEASLWDIVRILTNFVFVYWLTTYTGDAWLVYSGFTVLLAVSLSIGQALRARYAFAGCRINFSYWGDRDRIKQVFSFSGWSLFGSLGYLARTQLPAILLNKYYPPMRYSYVNSSYQVGGALASYTQSLSSALMGAFQPQIATLAGVGDKEGMLKTVMRASKFGSFLMVIMAIPLALEADYLLLLWLKNPPLLASTFCRLVLLQMILDNLTFGHMSGIMASGKIKWYQITTGSLCVLSVPVAWLVLALGGEATSVSWVIAGCMAACSVARLFFGRFLLNIRIVEWAKMVLFPILCVSFVSFIAGLGVVYAIEELSFLRIIITSIVSCVAMIVASWFFLFDQSEKNMLNRMAVKLKLKKQ